MITTRQAAVKARSALLVSCRGGTALALEVRLDHAPNKQECARIMASLAELAEEGDLFVPSFDGETLLLHPLVTIKEMVRFQRAIDGLGWTEMIGGELLIGPSYCHGHADEEVDQDVHPQHPMRH